MLHGRDDPLDDPARARSSAVRFAFDRGGFTIVDYRDIPGKNVVALIEDDQPCLAEREVRHAAEPILLLAHEDREKLLARPSSRSTTSRASPSSIPAASPRTFKAIAIEKGDLDAGLRARPTSSSRASTAPGTRSTSTSSRTA